MFERFAAKGPALIVGLMAALLPASSALAQTSKGGAAHTRKAAPTRSGPRVVSPPNAKKPTAPAASRPAAPAAAGAQVLQKNRPTAKPSGHGRPSSLPAVKPGAPKPPAKDPAWLDKQLLSSSYTFGRPKSVLDMYKNRKAQGGSGQSHGGGLFDFNLDAGTASNNIEPAFIPDDYSYVYSSDRMGADLYPKDATEPQFLVGPDYHLYLSIGVDPGAPRIRIPFPTGGDDRQEEFEPDVARDNTLVFSAFLPAGNEAYKVDAPDDPKCKDEDNNPVTFNADGMPVRVIRVSNGAIAAAMAGDDTVSVDKTLKPSAYTCASSAPDPDNPDAEGKIAPVLVPDASPVWLPSSSARYVYFVSLRGFKADDPDTHYTSLWVWDTANDQGAGNPRKVFSIPGMSILQPSFSADGKYLAYTVSDVSFGLDENNQITDPVWGFDVTKDALAKAFQARVWVAPVSGTSVIFGAAVQATAFTDADGNASRDMMPFWSPLDQLGFSTDRVDSDGDGLADTVNTDPTTAHFDIYMMPFTFNPACIGENIPDNTARRQTLGAAADDDSNELNGATGPANPDAPAIAYVLPFLIYQADDAGKWDIWLTDQAGDIFLNGNIMTGLPVVTGNPGLDDATKKGLKQTHRVGLPGDFVNIQVQVNPTYITTDPDGNSTTTVYAIMKDPDNASFQAIADPNINGGIPMDIYREVNDDIVNFCKDDFDNWSALFGSDPDGPRLGGVIPLSPVEGQPGVYSAPWYTPLEASDFLIDIAVQNDSGTFVTDNVGGFSTAPFVPVSRTLVVSDFAAGQKAIPFTTHTLLATNNPTESYFTWRPRANRTNEEPARGILSSLGPYNTGISSPWAVIGPRIQFQDAPTLSGSTDPNNPRIVVGPDGSLTPSDGLSNVSPFANLYDLWRVQCREPITVDDVKDASGNIVQYGVLKNYLPYLTQQPGYPIQAKARSQRVADRCVIWFSPFTGLLNGNGGQNSTAGNGGVDNKGFGTIANVATQAELLKFMTAQPAGSGQAARQAGRLAVSGATIASTLTQDGAVTNPLLTALNVKFESKQDFNVINGGESLRDQMKHSIEGPQAGENPIPYNTWEFNNLRHYGLYGTIDLEPTPTDIELAPYYAWVPFSEGRSFYHPRWGHSPPWESWQDAAWNQLYIGSVQAIGIGQPVWNYGTDGPQTPIKNTTVAAVQSKRPLGGDNTSAAKSLFFSFGLEGVNRFYYSGSNNLVHSPNRPAEIVHNIVDFLTTGAFTGQVFINNNVANTKDVLVYARDVYSQEGLGKIRGTALTDASGSYYMDGMDTGVYQLFAYKTGAVAVQNDVIQPIDTGVNTLSKQDALTLVNLYLVTAQPGTLRGQILDKDTGKPIAGIVVKIQDIQATVNQQTTTDANGNYVFTNVPAGLYVVTVPAQTVDGKDYEEFTNIDSPVNVTTDTAPNDPKVGDTIFNIRLGKRTVPPLPATLTVTVYDASTGENVPAPGATVTLTDMATNRPAVTTDGGPNPAVTDDNGQAVFHIIAGQFKVAVHYEKTDGDTRKVYKDQTVTLTVQPDDPANPGGTKLEFVFGGVLHTFTANQILMASAPYEYSVQQGLDFAGVLGITDRGALSKAIVAYDALKQDFTFFPTYPADTFHLGRGYGFKLPTDGKVYEQGTAATTANGYFVVRAEIGWNLIATPFTGPATFTGTGAASVKFALRDDPQQKLHGVDDLADSVTVSNILSPLWGPTRTDANGNGVYDGAYTPAVTTMQPWQSYWIKVAQPTLFYFPRPAVNGLVPGGRSIVEKDSPMKRFAADNLLMPRADVWGVNITASAGSIADRGLALGINRKGTARTDLGMDFAKPSPMSSSAPMIHTGFPRGGGVSDATDVRGPGANTWTFTVDTNAANQPVTLTWTANTALPAGATATLIDQATGQRVNMGTNSQYTYRSNGSGGQRTFKVEYR